MILSNEPGYYASGQYGIRIENLVAVEERETSADGRKFLGFTTLTLAPIDPRLTDAKLLTDAERTWLNSYHQRVVDTHSPHLSPTEKDWLQQYCRVV